MTKIQREKFNKEFKGLLKTELQKGYIDGFMNGYILAFQFVNELIKMDKTTEEISKLIDSELVKVQTENK